MRRWWTAAVTGALVALALTGCAPAGLDTDLTDDWPALAAAEAFVPEAGVCHLAVQDVGYLSAYNPVDCGESHRAETLYVGTLSGAAAERGTPPPAGSAGMRPPGGSATGRLARPSAPTGAAGGSASGSSSRPPRRGRAARGGSAATSARPRASTSPVSACGRGRCAAR